MVCAATYTVAITKNGDIHLSLQISDYRCMRMDKRECLAELADQAVSQFASRFLRPPRILVAAPGRVNLIGEHIDYNDGYVLPMAIERYVVIAADFKNAENGNFNDAAFATEQFNEGTFASFYSCNKNQQSNISLVQPTVAPNQAWSNYVAGVVAGFIALGQSLPAIDAAVISNVPIGGGLSSSAALEVAVATLLEEITGKRLEPAIKAKLCQQAEHDFAGVPCGIMDQFSSVFGCTDELMLLDCQSHQITPIPFPGDDISVLITNSNVSHELTCGGYAQRRDQCTSALAKLDQKSWRDVTSQLLSDNRAQLTEIEFKRARHVVTEINRTCQTAEAFKTGNWDKVGQLMYASHESLRDDYEVSCDELNTLVNLATQIGKSGGVIGARMTGGGFGGCTVTLVEKAFADSVADSLIASYREATGISPHCFTSRPARGAHVIKTTS